MPEDKMGGLQPVFERSASPSDYHEDVDKRLAEYRRVDSSTDFAPGMIIASPAPTFDNLLNRLNSVREHFIKLEEQLRVINDKLDGKDPTKDRLHSTGGNTFGGSGELGRGHALITGIEEYKQGLETEIARLGRILGLSDKSR